MKKIKGNEADWQKKVFKDLDYIKKNMRYPWKSGRKAPLVFWGIYITILILMSAFYLFSKSESGTKNLGFLSIIMFSLIFVGISVFRFLKSLKFSAINSGLSQKTNLQLTTKFLEQKHLLVFHHPECEDIMQILSRPIGNEAEQREVLIFIADENRVLINSHFTESGWRLTISQPHDKKIAAELNHFIENYKAQNKTQVILNI